MKVSDLEEHITCLDCGELQRVVEYIPYAGAQIRVLECGGRAIEPWLPMDGLFFWKDGELVRYIPSLHWQELLHGWVVDR